MIELEDPELQLPIPSSFSLVELLNHHVYLEAFFEGVGTLDPIVGQGITLRANDDAAPLFNGTVTKSTTIRSTRRIVATSFSFGFDLSKRLRCFPAQENFCPFHQTNGFAECFSWLNWADMESYHCASLFQYYETDWEFAARVAAELGSCLIASPIDHTVALLADPTAEHQVFVDDLDSESIETTEVLSNAQCRITGWNMPAAVNHTAEFTDPPEFSVVEDQVNNCVNDLLADAPSLEQLSETLISDDRATSKSEVISRMKRGAIRRWSGNLRNKPEIAVNHQVNLDDELGGECLRVWKRTLKFANGSFSNRIECAALQALPIELLNCLKPLPSVIQFGNVVEATDNSRQGRVKVRLSFMDGDGVWCIAPQPFAGLNSRTCLLPSPGDQVAVVVEPRGNSFPVILGSVYNNAVQIPEFVTNTTNQKLILGLGNLKLLADGEEGKLLLESGSIGVEVNQQSVKVSRGED